MTRWGGDCYIFGLMALGFADLIVERLPSLGRRRADPGGRRRGRHHHQLAGRRLQRRRPVLASGDRRVHDAALKLLAGQDRG